MGYFHLGSAKAVGLQWKTISLFVPTTRPDWPRWDRLAERIKALGAAGFASPTTSTVLGMSMLRAPTPSIRAHVLSQIQADFKRTGTVEISQLVFAHRLGLEEEVFELAGLGSLPDVFDPEEVFSHVHDPQEVFESGGLLPLIHLSIPANRTMMADRRFVSICHRLGLCDYWVEQDSWPDCTDFISEHYDFKAEARRLVAEKAAI